MRLQLRSRSVGEDARYTGDHNAGNSQSQNLEVTGAQTHCVSLFCS
jgi:hypothetical protein